MSRREPPSRTEAVGNLPRAPLLNRRGFVTRSLLGLGALATGTSGVKGHVVASSEVSNLDARSRRNAYVGPNVVIVRFGGGVRRRETIVREHSHCPYFLDRLAPRGTLFSNTQIAQLEDVETSHGQGTLYILTGRYDRYRDVRGSVLGQRFEAKVPTLFELLRQQYDVAEHEALIINGEDRTDEEFYSFSNHHLFGVDYRSSVLSLYRFKTFVLRARLAEMAATDPRRRELATQLDDLEAIDHRVDLAARGQSREIERFWERWRAAYGDSGLVNPRGDALLTELAVRALEELRPKLMMINYNDPDYVHWGIPSHYTRGIAAIDAGLERLVKSIDSLEAYRDNTVLCIVPDCGRDSNPAMRVPYQHHFRSRSSHEIFCHFSGPGIVGGQVIDTPVDQTSVTATVAAVMGLESQWLEAPVLEAAMA